MLSNCVKKPDAWHLPGCMVPGDVELFLFTFFVPRNERSKQIDIKLALWSRECLILVNTSVLCNR